MAQSINDNFTVLAGIPIDDRNVKSTLALRDAISSTLRFEGLTCYVAQTTTLYQLQGGITNSDWVGIAGENVALGFEVAIDGFLALAAGKTTLLSWEVGDKFRGWIGTRYLVGSILSLPVSLPADIDNASKVLLAVDSNNISPYVEPVTFTALSTGAGQTFTLPTGAVPKTVYKSKGWTRKGVDWSYSGNTLTMIMSVNAGNSIDVEF